MALQLSAAVRNAMLDAIETTIGTSAVLKIRTGAAPASVATADSGTVLATLTLPSDWMAGASSGSKAKSGTWEDASADAAGTAAHYRIYASDGTTAHLQGTVTATGGGGDLTVDNTSICGRAVVHRHVLQLDGRQQLDMNPVLRLTITCWMAAVNAILACELALTGGPGGIDGANVKDLGLGQFGLMVKRPTRPAATSPALVYHIGYVIFGRAEE
jgi:hypothetical protein